jgi:hypothetical protein
LSKVISIGALGGSGTRAVAQILMDAGIYMGTEFSAQKDNILFTRLFRNPDWKFNSTLDEIDYRIHVFEKIMSGKALTITEAKELNIAIKSNITYPTTDKKRRQFIFNLFIKPNNQYAIWGFKEPNSHVYLLNLNRHFKEFKYVHVLRHGLDMAFARNLKQLKNWGPSFGIETTGKKNELELARIQLDYWIAATQATLKQGETMGNRFLLVKHHETYNNPTDFVKKLLAFAGISVENDTLQKLFEIPKTPDTKDRFKNHDLNIFRDDQLRSVEDLGFKF